MIKNIEEVKEFLSKYNRPSIKTITTIKDGFVSCIGPVPGLFCPELHVSETTRPELNKLLSELSA